jgi:hypothetical protein
VGNKHCLRLILFELLPYLFGCCFISVIKCFQKLWMWCKSNLSSQSLLGREIWLFKVYIWLLLWIKYWELYFVCLVALFQICKNILYIFTLQFKGRHREKILFLCFKFFIHYSVYVHKINTSGSHRNKTFPLIKNKMVVS